MSTFVDDSPILSPMPYLIDHTVLSYMNVLLAQDPGGLLDEKTESRLYIGNLDLRITEAALIKMFSPYGKIVSEDFLWHTRGPKRGEPCGYAFIQYSTKEEAEVAKGKMHGRLACGRPLVVYLASEKFLEQASPDTSKGLAEASKSGFVCSSGAGQVSRDAKIAAIKNKLKALEEEDRKDAKKQKLADDSSFCEHGSIEKPQKLDGKCPKP